MQAIEDAGAFNEEEQRCLTDLGVTSKYYSSQTSWMQGVSQLMRNISTTAQLMNNGPS